MKKIIYILISLIVSLAVFNLIQTNRVYIKANVKNDCTVTLNYTNYRNKSETTYQRVFKYSDEGVQKIKLRLKDNVKSMNIAVEDNSLEIEKISVISGFIPYKLKSLTIDNSVFRNILILRIITSFAIGFILPLLIYYLSKYIYPRKEKFMVTIFIFMFCMPLLTIILPLEKVNIFNIVGEHTVYNFPKLTFKSYFNKSYQQQFEGWFNQKIIWNALYIKLFNSVYYALFDKSYSSNGGIIIGKGKQLYEKAYITTLFFPDRYTDTMNIPTLTEVKALIDSQAEDLRKIQDWLESKGKVFLFVNTPSKADFEEDKIPDRFEVGTVTYQTYLHNTLINALSTNGINYVDTPTYLKSKAGYSPVYAVGGIHWNDRGKILATQSIVEKLNKITNYNFDNVRIQKAYINKFPQNEDRDLVTLLNLFYLPKKYTVETLIYEPSKKSAPDIKVKVIGGSFSSGFCDGLTLSHTFKNIDYYFYITRKLIRYRDYLRQDVIEDASIKNVSKNIKNAIDTDILILELNDSVIGTKKGHLTAFIAEMKKIMADDKK